MRYTQDSLHNCDTHPNKVKACDGFPAGLSAAHLRLALARHMEEYHYVNRHHEAGSSPIISAKELATLAASASVLRRLRDRVDITGEQAEVADLALVTVLMVIENCQAADS